MPNAEFWNKKFDTDLTADSPVFAGEPNPTVARIISRIRSSFPGAPDTASPSPSLPRAIDLGSGRGRHVVWLARNGWDATALDFSRVGLEHTRRALEAEDLHAQLLHEDLTDWSPQAQSFDVVLTAYIHLPRTQQETLWQQVGHALKPGGYFVSVSHHPDNQLHGPQDTELLYTAQDVAQYFGAGYKAQLLERDVVKQEGNKQAIDAVVVLKKL